MKQNLCAIIVLALISLASESGAGQTKFVSQVRSSNEQFVFNAVPLHNIEFPKLIAFTGNGGLWVWNCEQLAVVYAPKLQTCANFVCGQNGIVALALPALTAVNCFDVNNCDSLTSLSIANLRTVNVWVIIQHNPLLTALSVPLLSPANGVQLVFTDNALDQASVDGILRRCVATDGFISGQVLLDGGNNAPPSAQGLADKADLIDRGITVTTN